MKNREIKNLSLVKLAKLLPSEVKTDNDIFFLNLDKTDNGYWCINYSNVEIVKELLPRVKMTHNETLHSEGGKDLTTAMSKMLIYLIENKLINL